MPATKAITYLKNIEIKHTKTGYVVKGCKLI